jgi:excinuclease ABC subunit A
MENIIRVRGARQHNLKNINLDIPKNKLVVFTGVSGSGKSSLAFDTIYAEGQRRYVESLSTYARQFLGIMDKPDVDSIEGLSPSISIDQKTTSKNPRSTVGTVTEIYDYLRLLYARIGHPHCPVCGREIAHQSLDQIVNKTITLLKETVNNKKIARYLIMSPVVSGKKGEFSNLFDNLKSKGYKQVRVDGYIKNTDEYLALIKTNKHNIEVIIDRLSFSKDDLKKSAFIDSLKLRLAESIEQALLLSDGLVIMAQVLDEGFTIPEYPKKFTDHLFSEKFSCPVDNIQLPEIEPRTFSFNSPYGACPKCTGLGKILKIDPVFVFNDELTITEGGIMPFSNMFEHDTWYSRIILQVCSENGIDPRTAIKNLNQNERDLLLYGTGNKEYKVEGTNRFGKLTYIWDNFSGIVNELEKRYKQTDSDFVRAEIEKYMREYVCPDCRGDRLKKEALAITVNNLSISELCRFSITKTLDWINDLYTHNLVLNDKEKEIAQTIVREIKERLSFLISVGLEYITLERAAGSLSGGEAQRIRLASQIGSGLTGVLYVLDEPTIGLHPKDDDKLINTLKKLRDLGNTVIVVEHDKAMMKSADYIFDFGPGAGDHGGKIIAQGTPKQINNNPKSITGLYLSGKKKVSLLKDKLPETENHYLTIKGCNKYNLKDIDVAFPLGKMVVITGVSGSGKSTLLVETLYPALEKETNIFYRGSVGGYRDIEGLDKIDKVILIDQSPIGRTPRSNPATYTGLFDPIRDVFSQTKEAKVAGFKKGRFSFNLKGGRCDACEGQGQTKIEMQFMSDIWIACDVCQGKRYNAQTLEVMYRGKNIAEILSLSVDEALTFFAGNPMIVSKLETLSKVGLGYIKLGQPATTLSGGEAQRIKLSSELSRKETGKTVYILDEPTTGLHFADVEKLLRALKLLTLKGNSVFVIEHNMDIIKNADYIIDLGPEGGEKGGQVVARGKVADIVKNPKSYTGKYLAKERG